MLRTLIRCGGAPSGAAGFITNNYEELTIHFTHLFNLIFMGNPVLKEQSRGRLGRMLLSSGATFSRQKTPCENSGKLEPATSPVIPHFPHLPNFRGHNSEKYGTGPELFNDFRWERMRSNIAMLRRPIAGWDVIWGSGGHGLGDPISSQGGIRDKEEFSRADFSSFDNKNIYSHSRYSVYDKVESG
jgi:hypothetical protein